KLLLDPSGVAMIQENLITLLIGNVIAFIVAMGAIKFFIEFLTRHGFKAFGYYRIIVGSILLALIISGVDLSNML
ncbi:MAG: UDP-diphosphatase, partial [Bacteroidales bacterium]|nr:UDP-diphosphatase [Bacteroidales bacterium]